MAASNDQECPVCLEHRDILLPLDQCSHKMCILCVIEFEASQSYQCALCRAPFNKNVTERAAPISFARFCEKYDPAHPVWLYAGRRWGWWMFEPSTSEKLETAFQCSSQRHNVEVKEGVHRFTLSFDTMTQIRPTTAAKRKIRRMTMRDLPSDVKGVAGIRFAR